MADAPHNSYMNYADGESDFKRKADPKKDIRMTDDDEEENEHEGKFPGKPNDYFIKELLSERVQMDGKYPHADRLLQQGMGSRQSRWRVQNNCPPRVISSSRTGPCKAKWKTTTQGHTIRRLIPGEANQGRG